MRRLALVLATLLLTATTVQAAGPDFDHWFVDRTMRVDIDHTGGMGDDIRAVDQIVSDGSWAGSRTQLIDNLNLGQYLFTVVDQATNQAIYSRGYSALFGEWLTTPASKSTHRTFHESLRFPWPRNPVRVIVETRDDQNHFYPVWSTAIDPNSRFVNPADPSPHGTEFDILVNGDPKTKVDILILGDGYTKAETEKFHADAERMTKVLFTFEPFKSRQDDFNVRALLVPADEPGISRPRAGEFHRNPVSTTYNTLDSERYALVHDNKTMREIASGTPYEFIEVLLNEKQYGGGGIFNDHATASVGAGFANYLFVHEFGHHFAGLADEYYTSDVAYETGRRQLPEPWEPNVTALHDPANVKWKDLVASSTPLPTPWEKEEYEKVSREQQARRNALRAKKVPETVMDDFFNEVKAWSTPFLAGQKYAGKVGAFEGAAYEAKGLYRPEIDCIMFTRDDVGFCRVCQRAITRIIDLYSK